MTGERKRPGILEKVLFGKPTEKGKRTLVTRAILFPLSPREALGLPPRQKRVKKPAPKVSYEYNRAPKKSGK